MNMMKRNSLSLSLSLSLSRRRFHPRIVLFGVFLLCACVGGVVAGSYIKHWAGDANAASENITVTNNNQVSTVDQGTSQIVRTSRVTVKDTTATAGYILKARIENNSIPNSTVSIYSATSTTCTESSPCTLTSDSTSTPILETTTDATQPQGHTTDWTITITLPGVTAQGNYTLDIAYSEDPKIPLCPAIQGKTYLQDVRSASSTSFGQDRERVTLRDRRNNQNYYVQNIVNADGSCLAWMETNLRYAGDGTWYASLNYPDDRYATTAVNAISTANPNDGNHLLTTITAGHQASSTLAQMADAGGSADYTNTTAVGGFYGYLYNWCAAMGGQGGACQETTAVQPDQNQSICPAGWRLPTGGPGGEFEAMNTAVNGGATNTDAGLRTNFLGVYPGYTGYGATGGLAGQGVSGNYWSSNVYSTTAAHSLIVTSNYVETDAFSHKEVVMTVRCVLE